MKMAVLGSCRPLRASPRRPRASRPPAPVAHRSPAPKSGRPHAATVSRRRSASICPSAERCPGKRGTRTRVMPSSSATCMTCIGPAPPKPSRVKSRGSKPRCTDTSRTAPAILATAIPSAAPASATKSSFALPAPCAREAACACSAPCAGNAASALCAPCARSAARILSSPRARNAACAFSASSTSPPESGRPAGRRPSSRFASDTVGSVPPPP